MKPPIFDDEIPDFGTLMTVEEFKNSVRHGFFTDYDGHGRLVKGDKMDSARTNYVYPSQAHRIPSEATHVMWFNK